MQHTVTGATLNTTQVLRFLCYLCTFCPLFTFNITTSCLLQNLTVMLKLDHYGSDWGHFEKHMKVSLIGKTKQNQTCEKHISYGQKSCIWDFACSLFIKLSHGAWKTTELTWQSLASWSALSADLSRESRWTRSSRLTWCSVFSWGPWSAWGCHHFYWHLHAGHVVGHSLWKGENKRAVRAEMSYFLKGETDTWGENSAPVYKTAVVGIYIQYIWSCNNVERQKCNKDINTLAAPSNILMTCWRMKFLISS